VCLGFLGGSAGIVGLVLFTAGFLAQEAFRRGEYNPPAEPVSTLEVGAQRLDSAAQLRRFRPAHHRIRRRAAPRPARCGQASLGRHCSSSALSRHVRGRPRNRSLGPDSRSHSLAAESNLLGGTVLGRASRGAGPRGWPAEGDLRAASGKEPLVLTSLDHAFNGRSAVDAEGGPVNARGSLSFGVGRSRGAGDAGGPGGQQAQTFGRRRAWLGGVDKHRQTRIGSYRELLVGQHKLAHYRTAKPLRPSPVGANVMGTPQAVEHIAAGGKLSTRSCIARSCGSRPASARMTATHISANSSARSAWRTHRHLSDS
jgi:hypothetical protein